MGKSYDAGLNRLLDARPGEWATYFGSRFGIPPGPTEVIDTDLATTMQADKVYRVNGSRPAVLHLEFESASFLGLPTTLFRYNSLLTTHNGPPVHTVLLLLRPEANASDRTGVYERVRADGRVYLRFEYEVIRLWQESFDALLTAGPTLAPLALLTDEATEDFEPALRRFGERVQQPDIDTELRQEMLDAGYNLAGLRLERALIRDLYARLNMDKIMRHSTTYQGTLAEGRAEGRLTEARQTLLRQGRKKFGEPPADATAAIEGITALPRLEELSDRLLDVNSWDELLATP